MTGSQITGAPVCGYPLSTDLGTCEVNLHNPDLMSVLGYLVLSRFWSPLNSEQKWHKLQHISEGSRPQIDVPKHPVNIPVYHPDNHYSDSSLSQSLLIIFTCIIIFYLVSVCMYIQHHPCLDTLHSLSGNTRIPPPPTVYQETSYTQPYW